MRTPGGNRASAEARTDTLIVAEASGLDKRTRHPLSANFGDMPDAQFAELVADIKHNGLLTAITTSEDGAILDGWHRYRACIAAGVKPRFEPFKFVVEPAAETAGRTMTEAEFVCSQNAHRRHLTTEQKRKVVLELLKADPTKSDRTVAAMAKVSDKTVGAVRARAEAVAEIPQQRTRTTSDGKVRKVAKKKSAKRKPAKATTKPASTQNATPKPLTTKPNVELEVPAELLAAMPVAMSVPHTPSDTVAADILAQIEALNPANLTNAEGFAGSLMLASKRFVVTPTGVPQ
jgi:hypothetical protein